MIQANGQRIRVAGDVEGGSIQRKGDLVEFVLIQDKLKLKVAYTGSEPLPDTFRDGAQALADGKMGTDGVFHASKVQAKCASKYEAKPGLKPGQTRPNIKHLQSRLTGEIWKIWDRWQFSWRFAWPCTPLLASVVGRIKTQAVSDTLAASARSMPCGRS